MRLPTWVDSIHRRCSRDSFTILPISCLIFKEVYVGFTSLYDSPSRSQVVKALLAVTGLLQEWRLRSSSSSGGTPLCMRARAYDTQTALDELNDGHVSSPAYASINLCVICLTSRERKYALRLYFLCWIKMSAN